MTDLCYAVVIPTIGRSRLAELVACVDGNRRQHALWSSMIGTMPPLISTRERSEHQPQWRAVYLIFRRQQRR
jgi:hypothetical protein